MIFHLIGLPSAPLRARCLVNLRLYAGDWFLSRGHLQPDLRSWLLDSPRPTEDQSAILDLAQHLVGSACRPESDP